MLGGEMRFTQGDAVQTGTQILRQWKNPETGDLCFRTEPVQSASDSTEEVFHDT